jgi:hypothetical protein
MTFLVVCPQFWVETFSRHCLLSNMNINQRLFHTSLMSSPLCSSVLPNIFKLERSVLAMAMNTGTLPFVRETLHVAF